MRDAVGLYRALKWRLKYLIKTFTSTTFCVGDIFKVYYGEDSHVEITLYKITKGRYKLCNATREPFNLIFRGSKDFVIHQGIFLFEHEKIGRFEMFLVPMVPPDGDPEFNYYQSVFS